METKEIVTNLIDRVICLSVNLDREQKERMKLQAEKEALQGVRPISPRDGIDLINAMASGKKIEAIKAYRSITGHGLVESKAAIESIMNKMAS